jgi:Arc/MetJ-type ribon-helix-helix transcriptional regulator
MPVKPQIYTEVEVIKLTKTQKETLIKLRKYNVNKSQFIREAIAEKLQREGHEIKQKAKKQTGKLKGNGI